MLGLRVDEHVRYVKAQEIAGRGHKHVDSFFFLEAERALVDHSKCLLCIGVCLV